MRIIRPLEVTDARLVASNVLPSTDPEWDSATTYNEGEVVQVAAVHKRYEALASSTDAYPPDAVNNEPPEWLELGPTDQWAMFDGRIGTYSESSEPWLEGAGQGIQVEITPGRVVNALAFFGLQGTSLRVEMIDPVEGSVYDETRSLNSSVGIDNWYAYLFDPVDRIADAVFLDLPSYRSATIRVSLQGVDGSAQCALCIIGNQREVGGTQYGTSVGILDFSRKERDTFGRIDVVERNYSKRVNFDLLLEANRTDVTQRMLAEYRATPIVWIGSDRYESTIVYGYYRDFDIVLANFPFSECSIEVEGLT